MRDITLATIESAFLRQELLKIIEGIMLFENNLLVEEVSAISRKYQSEVESRPGRGSTKVHNTFRFPFITFIVGLIV
jgi:hypothetical protein